MNAVSKNELVYKTCLLLVQHFRNLLDAKFGGFNSRIFQHMLHWEYEFVGIGESIELKDESTFHPEHVVPCAVLISETCRLIELNVLSNEEIATLLQKHWKIAKITKEQAKHIDYKLGYKSSMPKDWSFETGNTLARLELAKITLETI